jgi:hypothetical protein
VASCERVLVDLAALALRGARGLVLERRRLLGRERVDRSGRHEIVEAAQPLTQVVPVGTRGHGDEVRELAELGERQRRPRGPGSSESRSRRLSSRSHLRAGSSSTLSSGRRCWRAGRGELLDACA